MTNEASIGYFMLGAGIVIIGFAVAYFIIVKLCPRPRTVWISDRPWTFVGFHNFNPMHALGVTEDGFLLDILLTKDNQHDFCKRYIPKGASVIMNYTGPHRPSVTVQEVDSTLSPRLEDNPIVYY